MVLDILYNTGILNLQGCKNEVDAIQKLGGYVIKVQRNSCTDLHPSELEQQRITDYNYLIDNVHSKEALYDQIDKIMSKI